MRPENFASSRRRFVSASAAAAAALALDRVGATACLSGLGLSAFAEASADKRGREMSGFQSATAEPCADLLRGGIRTAVLPLDDLEAPDVPMHRIVGRGLDARLFTDLSSLDPGASVTPTKEFFVRTTRPGRVPATDGWTLDVSGDVAAPATIPLASLAPHVQPMGTHLVECAGNARAARFGLISVAEWAGIPIAAIFARARPRSRDSLVLVTGVDDEDAPAMTSTAGASWVFTQRALLDAHAVLATRMNGEPLTPDHGAPVRLLVPGWYGCACIKWVTGIAWVDGRAPATSQMKEFAARTHQSGVPALARDYEPATIDLAAMPVRVEKWRVGERTLYRLIGIVWGGDTAVPPLLIRFNPREPFVQVNGCPRVPSAAVRANWAVWTHTWRPESPGRYQIVLKVGDPKIRTRRLDLYFYTRTVRIDEN